MAATNPISNLTIDGATYDLDPDYLGGKEASGYLKRGIFYVEGSSTADGTWLGSHADITEYFDGLTILYKINKAGGSSTTTLNINSLGAKTVYRQGTTKLTTHYPVNSVIILAYMADLNSGCWMVLGDYAGSTVNNATITLAAGNGLTTGGSFTTNASSAKTITFNVGAGAGISVTADTVALATSGVTAGSYGPSAAASPAHGGNFNVPYITVDTYGRVTAASNSKITLPSYSAAKYNTLGLLKPAYTTTGAVTLTTAAASNASTPTINAKTETAGRYYAVEADKNGVPFVNVPWTEEIYATVEGDTLVLTKGSVVGTTIVF